MKLVACERLINVQTSNQRGKNGNGRGPLTAGGGAMGISWYNRHNG